MKPPGRTRYVGGAVILAGAFAFSTLGWTAEQGKASPTAESPEAYLRKIEKAVKEFQSPSPGAPTPAQKVVESATSQLDFFGLLPGKSNKADVELLLSDPIRKEDDRLAYQPPNRAPDVDRVEAVFLKGSRTLQRLDVILKTHLVYGDMSLRAGRPVLLEKDEKSWVWEYYIPSLLALGYLESKGGPPLFVERLRYVSPQYLADRFIAEGSRAENERRTEDALTEYEKATRIDPGYAATYLKMGALYEKNRVKEKTFLYYTATTLAAYPKSVKAEGFYRIGLIYQGDNKTDPALEAFTRALAEDPSHAGAYFRIGVIYQTQLKKPLEALAAYKKAATLRPDFAAAYYNMGLIYEANKDLTRAAWAYQKAVESRPDLARASHKLTLVKLGLNDFPGAQEESRRRLAADPNDTTAMVFMAMALSSQVPDRHAVVGVLNWLLSKEDPRLKEALEWLDKAVSAGYKDKANLEESPYLRQVREQETRAFNKIVSRIGKPRE